MSVVGFDFGTLASKIGVARHRGIDIITNEVSNRATPSLVAFTLKSRQIGESAKTQETSNFKNTIGSLKRLVGRTVSDVDVAGEDGSSGAEKKFINAQLIDVPGGGVGVKVTFRSAPQTFSAIQLVGMYLSKLRTIASAELKIPVSDVVISVPGWFTDVQRRATLDAAAIGGLNVLRLINDTTAAALGYGITKSDLPDLDAPGADEAGLRPRNVVFVDLGHSDLGVSVVSFWKGNLAVKASAYDRHLGGRDIDYALVRHFADEFKTKYKIDVLSNPKATFRLLAGTEKLKKVLSANNEGALNVESIMNDIDASSKLNREEYEALIRPLLDRIPAPIQQAVADSGIPFEEIDAIELIGGSTRIPAVRAQILSVFPGKQLSFTLNQDEAVARGATFACAMLSPVFRVREFHLLDITHYPIKFTWEPTGDGEDNELEVFRRGNNVPSTKVLTFYRKPGESFEVQAVYGTQPGELPGSISPWIGRAVIKDVPPPQKGSGQKGEDGTELTCVRVKTRLSNHGVLSVEGAYVEEVEEREEPSTAMDVDAPAPEDGQAAPPPPPKKKRITKKVPLQVLFYSTALSPEALATLKETENQLFAQDKLVFDTEDRKNALEEYIYDMRGKLDERYAAFVKPAEKEALSKELTEKEEWLYTEEGEDATKSAYVERLDVLKKLGDPITFRWQEATNLLRPAVSSLRETLDLYLSQATAAPAAAGQPAGPHDHIDSAEKQKVIEKVETTRQWLDDKLARQAERPKNEDPIVTSEEVGKKRDEVIYFVTPILSKPKPKIPTTSGTDTPKKDGTETPKNKGTETPKEEPKAEADKGPSEMDID